MGKYIIREVQEPDFSIYFDGDTFSEGAGDYGYNVFCITNHYGNYYSGLNEDAFKDITKEMDAVIDEIDGIINAWSYYTSVKEVMTDYHLQYSPRSAHALKLLIDENNYIEQLCGYLTIKTGKIWTSRAAHGYCQGDYADVVYCKDFYTDNEIDIIGELYLGCGKEFCLINLDDNGKEIDSCYGYFVADCQGYNPVDYKTIVCDMEGIDYQDATLELIERIETIHNAVYTQVA